MVLRSDDTIQITTDFMVALNEAENRKDLKAREEAARKERRAVETGWWDSWYSMVDRVNAGKGGAWLGGAWRGKEHGPEILAK